MNNQPMACPHCGRRIQKTDLSPREKQVIEAALRDKSQTATAREWNKSIRTVTTFWIRVREKCDCATNLGVIGKLFREKRIDENLRVIR